LALGWYEPPVSARRHLAKPLKRESTRLASSQVDG
jgi:tRNA(Ile2) C34 agmatinyltransferase TiaS